MEPQNNFPLDLNQHNEPPVSPMEAPLPQKSPKRFLWLALIILGTLVIVGTVYAFLTYNQPARTTEIVQSGGQLTTDNQNITATSTIPTDWKTYRNEKYGFEISYPNNWGIVSSSSQPSGYLSVGFGQTNIKDPNYDGEFFVSVITQKSSYQYETELRSEEVDRLGNSEITKQSVIAGELTGYHFTVTNTEVQKLDSKWMREIIIFERDNNLFLISNGAVRNSLFENFYKSFKFTQEVPSINVISPNGGETIPLGQFTVRWSASNLVGNVTVYLTSVAGVCRLGTYPVNKGFNTFDISPSNPCLGTSKTITSGQYKVRLITDTQSSVSDLGVLDDSDSYFTITPATGY